jgi:hypothetical protein
MLNENLNFYDILEIAPDASAEEIREAYLRIKATYQKEHVALYTLFSPIEREEILRKTEAAYLVLSDSDKRRAYDQNHGLIVWEENPFTRREPAPTEQQNQIETAPVHLAEVVSIDRTPPMEANELGEEALIAPSTDYAAQNSQGTSPDFKGRNQWIQGSSRPSNPNINQSTTVTRLNPKKASSSDPTYPATLLKEIHEEKDWSGSFIKKLRESLGISIEELSEITKISKNYLKAIEEENFEKLPAAVYVRGFTLQIARTLKLPTNQVFTAYLSRYHRKLTG